MSNKVEVDGKLSVTSFYLSLAAYFIVLAAYPPTMHPGWHGDDYNQVFGTPLTPVLSLLDALRLGGMGSLSPARLLNFPLMGYGGWLLGPVWAYRFQAGVHWVCALLLFGLLFQMGWSQRRAALTSALFGCAPWLSQSVYWWAAVSVPVESLLVLLAFLGHLKWRRGGSRSSIWLGASLLLQFTARFFYESWLLAPIAILGMELVLSRAEGLGWRLNISRSLKRTAVHLIPYILWAGCFLLVDDSGVRQPSRSVVRFFISLISVHARVINWFTDISWLTVLRDGLREARSEGTFILMSLILVGLFIYERRHQPTESSYVETGKFDWLSTLILAAGFYWGSRLVFTLGGGIDTHTRHHYGGSMGLAIFVSGILENIVARGGRARRVGIALEIALPLLLALASLGIGVHYRETARAEEATYKMLLADAKATPAGSVMIVTGRPTQTRGELEFYETCEGVWLEFRLRAMVPGIRAYVVDEVEIENGVLRTIVHSRQSWTPPIRKSEYRSTEPVPPKEAMLGGGAYRLELPMHSVKIYDWKDGKLRRRQSL